MELVKGEASVRTDGFLKIIRQPMKFRLFLMKNLPAALFSGVRMEYADSDRAITSVPYKWFTRNPFRSTYFACLSMAAEMSTGILAMSAVYDRNPAVSLIVTAVEGNFIKKATGTIRFTCEQGKQIRQAVETALLTGTPQAIRVLSSGYNDQKEPVAEFYITWSFKKRQTSNPPSP